MMVEGNDTLIIFFRSRAPVKIRKPGMVFLFNFSQGWLPLKKFDAVGAVLKKVGLNQV
jgi:hypothetical protein